MEAMKEGRERMVEVRRRCCGIMLSLCAGGIALRCCCCCCSLFIEVGGGGGRAVVYKNTRERLTACIYGGNVGVSRTGIFASSNETSFPHCHDHRRFSPLLRRYYNYVIELLNLSTTSRMPPPPPNKYAKRSLRVIDAESDVSVHSRSAVSRRFTCD